MERPSSTNAEQSRLLRPMPADAGRSGAEEQVALVLEGGALDPAGVDHARQRDARGPLHVVVVAADLVAVPFQQVYGIDPGPVLEMDAAPREDILHRIDEFIDEAIEVLGLRPRLPQPQIEGVAEQRLV